MISVKGRGAESADPMSVVAFADPAGWPSTNTTPQVKELKNFQKKF
jgi:hypothetical protein